MSYICTGDIKISILASITVSAVDIMFTTTITSQTITDWKLRLVVNIGTKRITLARLTAWRISRPFNSQGIAEKSLCTPLTIKSIRMINTSQTLSRVCITVANGTWVHVAVTVTFLARPHTISSGSHWISKIPILAFLTSWSYWNRMSLYFSTNALVIPVITNKYKYQILDRKYPTSSSFWTFRTNRIFVTLRLGRYHVARTSFRAGTRLAIVCCPI